MLRLDIRGVNAYPLEKEVLTEGRVGLEIIFTFSSDWDGLTKIAVFEGAQTIDVILENDRCVVPHEALAQSGAALRIGVYGQNTAGDIVIPTVWAKFGMVEPAAVPSEVSSKPPTPSVVAQILSAAQNAESSASEAERIAQSVRDDADAGEFDGKDGVDGSTLWSTTVEPQEPMGGGFEFLVRDLTGVSDLTPKVGDIIFYDSAYYPITSITGHTIVDKKAVADLKVDIRGEEGEPGPAGADGQDGLDGSAIWKSSAPPTVIQQGGFTIITFNLSDLSGPDGHTIQSDDLIFYGPDYYTVGIVGDTTCTALGKTSIKGDTGPSDLFYCTYGTTTSAQIEAALTAGQIPAVIRNDVLYVYAYKTSATKHYFGSTGLSSLSYQYLVEDNGTWNAASLQIVPSEVTVSTAGAVTQALDAGKIYHFTGELTALTITLNTPASGQIAHYHVDFDCGSAAPTVTIPNTVTMPDSNSFESNRHYEVDILNNYGAVISWANS